MSHLKSHSRVFSIMRNRANHYLASNILFSLSLSSISIVCSTKEEGDDSQNRFIYIYTHTKDTRSNLESRRPGKKLVPLPPPLALVGPLDKLLRGDKGVGVACSRGEGTRRILLWGHWYLGNNYGEICCKPFW